MLYWCSLVINQVHCICYAEEAQAAAKIKLELSYKELALFWKLLPVVLQRAPPASRLQDLGVHKYVVADSIYPSDWEDPENMVINLVLCVKILKIICWSCLLLIDIHFEKNWRYKYILKTVWLKQKYETLYSFAFSLPLYLTQLIKLVLNHKKFWCYSVLFYLTKYLLMT